MSTSDTVVVPVVALNLSAQILSALVLALDNPERIPTVQQILRETAQELRNYAQGATNEG